MCGRDGLVVRTKCCKCVKPGSIPQWLCRKHFNISQTSLFINSIRDEKELSRIKKELKQM